MAAANDLEALLINRQASDPDILRRFVGRSAPQVVNTNQMIALLNAGLYSQADSVADFVADNEQSHLLLAVNAVLNGRYEDNFNTVAQTGKRNELIMLLAMKRNKEASELSKTLPEDEALTHYLRAICLNRLDDPVDAYKALKKALEEQVSREHIYIHCNGREQLLPVSEVLFMERKLKKTLILQVSGNEYLVSAKPDELIQQLKGSSFVRCHQSFWVNLDHIRSMGPESFLLTTGQEIPISRSRRAEAKAAFHSSLCRSVLSHEF